VVQSYAELINMLWGRIELGTDLDRSKRATFRRLAKKTKPSQQRQGKEMQRRKSQGNSSGPASSRRGVYDAVKNVRRVGHNVSSSWRWRFRQRSAWAAAEAPARRNSQKDWPRHDRRSEGVGNAPPEICEERGVVMQAWVRELA
jgi:hypothetical protein